MTVEARQFFWQLVVTRDFFHEFVVFAVMFEDRFAHQPTAFDAEMILGDGKRIFSPNFLNSDASDRFTVGNDVMRIIGGTQEIAVETAALAHTVQTMATVT